VLPSADRRPSKNIFRRGDFLEGLRVVRRDRLAGDLGGEADLLERFRSG
jgi:hypothetical protein